MLRKTGDIMKPELPQLKLQLHLAKGWLHLDNIIKIIY